MSWKSTKYFVPENGRRGEKMYEIVYDYTDLSGFEIKNIHEYFSGTWTELQAYIRTLRKQGCYHISAASVDGS